MNRPKIACCNFMGDVKQLRAFALDHGFDGVDWTFTNPDFPLSPAAQTELIHAVQSLHPLEVRFHCAFSQTDLGDEDPEQAAAALRTFQAVCRLVSKLQGRYITIHIGLGRDSTLDLCWERTLVKLSDLVQFARKSWLRLCLENLAWGWTSRPELFEKLLRKSGVWATLDIGHAQVCPAVSSKLFTIEDFVHPQPDRICNAHIYDAENHTGHLPPRSLADIRHRLDLLHALPLCDWWVLELREEQPCKPPWRSSKHILLKRQEEALCLGATPPEAPLYQS